MDMEEASVALGWVKDPRYPREVWSFEVEI
jgi:hypothetical protein